MLRLHQLVWAAVPLSALAIRPTQAAGRWGAEVSPNLSRFGLTKAFSRRNELVLRLEYDWTELIQDEREESQTEQYPDTTYEHEYSTDQDYSRARLSLEAGFRRYFGSGNGLSPTLGLAVKVSPTRDRHSWERDEGNRTDYISESTRTGAELSLLLSGGCRFLFTKHFALSLQSDIASYTYAWEESEYRTQWWDEYGDMSTNTSEYSGTSGYLQMSLRPSLYLQYYF